MALGLGAAVPIGPVNVQIARRALRGRFLAGAALGCGAVTADVTYAALSSLSLARLLNRPMAVNLIGAAGTLLLTWLGVGCLRAAVKAWRSDPIAADGAPEDGGGGLSRRSGPNLPNTAAEAAPTRTPTGNVAAQPVPAVSPKSHSDRIHSSYLTGLLMTLLNPMTLAFWFTVVPATTAVANRVPATPPPAVARVDAGAAPAGTAKLTQEHTSNLPITCAGVFIGTLAWVITFSGLLALAGRRRRNGWLAAADAAGGVTLLFFAVVMVWRLIAPHL